MLGCFAGTKANGPHCGPFACIGSGRSQRAAVGAGGDGGATGPPSRRAPYRALMRAALWAHARRAKNPGHVRGRPRHDVRRPRRQWRRILRPAIGSRRGLHLDRTAVRWPPQFDPVRARCLPGQTRPAVRLVQQWCVFALQLHIAHDCPARPTRSSRVLAGANTRSTVWRVAASKERSTGHTHPRQQQCRQRRERQCYHLERAALRSQTLFCFVKLASKH